MADPTYVTKVYETDGGNTLVVASGGKIKIETGGQIVPNSGTQASAIASPTSDSVGTKAAIDAIIAAIKAAGITA